MNVNKIFKASVSIASAVQFKNKRTTFILLECDSDLRHIFLTLLSETHLFALLGQIISNGLVKILF